MTDASTTQLLTVALLSGVGSALLTAGLPVLTKLGEFRREDHSRWVTEKREQYAKLIDEVTGMSTGALLGQIAASVLEGDKGFSDDAEPVRRMVREHADAVFDHHQRTSAPAAALRLLAPMPVVDSMVALERAAGELMKHYLSLNAAGGPHDLAGAVAARDALDSAIEAFTAAARKDIRA